MSVSRSVQQLLSEFFRQILERFIYIHPVIFSQGVDHLAVESAELHGAEDYGQSSVRNTEFLVDYLAGIQLLRISYATAYRTCSERCVKREHPGLQFFNTHTVIRTSQLAAESSLVMPIVKISHDIYQSLAMSHGQFTGL